MQLDASLANDMAQRVAVRLTGGHVDVYDREGARLARCPFAANPFADPEDGAIAAYPFPSAIAERDGVPFRFEARDAIGELALTGTAGYREDIPKREMQFKTRRIVEGADVQIESFVFSVVAALSASDQQAT